MCADLVMMKVEPKFRLDCTYKGPYRVLDVTSTNAIIQKVNDPDSEKLNVSLQRLSKCDRQLSEEVPWMGHGRSRRRQIRKTARPNFTEQQSTNVVVTRRGRVIRPLLCF